MDTIEIDAINNKIDLKIGEKEFEKEEKNKIKKTNLIASSQKIYKFCFLLQRDV